MSNEISSNDASSKYTLIPKETMMLMVEILRDIDIIAAGTVKSNQVSPNLIASLSSIQSKIRQIVDSRIDNIEIFTADNLINKLKFIPSSNLMTINGKPINFQLLHNCAGKSFVPIDYITADKNDETCTIRTVAEFSRVLNGITKNSKNSGGTDLAFIVPGLRMEVTSRCTIDSLDAPNKTISDIRFVPKDTDEPASAENPS